MSGEVAKTGQTIRDIVHTVKSDFLQSITDEKVWEREASFAIQALAQNEYLLNTARANPASLKTAIHNIALTGATLNPVLQKAYLVPRKVLGKQMVCLDFGYRGLAGIAMDSGAVKHIQPYLVYNFDEFSYWIENGEAKIKHIPNLEPPKEFNSETFWSYLKCGYCVTILNDGIRLISPPMNKWQLEKAMKTSKTSSENTPWRTHPDEQCKKTLVKHTYKLLPQTQQMSHAVSALNEHEGIDINPTPFADSLKKPKEEDFQLIGDPICVCEDMVSQGYEEYDCPAHGLRKKPKELEEREKK